MFTLGILIHLTFLYSIFDIYFKSPIVKNVVPYQPHHDAAADRLVLFVVDGLRAESFLNYTTMNYLRSVANSKGRWGISNTQMPTESRPGHVALIAGFYEDPSAIFKGWKENPVDFDSVFNQSTYTWSWGTYDIVNIFTKGITDDHITVQDFDPYEQSFSTDKNTTQLDAWVFNKVKVFFDDARNNSDVQQKLKQKKIIFFLHLLGTDTAGHTHKPKTANFLTTLAHVDDGIQEIEQLIRDYYSDDGKTTFLMTSDHGMTDWGSHGSGYNHETETPYVIWGSGVKQVREIQLDPETLEMSLEHRLDINQVDLTPLMSTILSIPVPVNSIGKPIYGLLDTTLPNEAKSIYSISRQLASQYNKKRQEVETNALPMLYQPYEPFTKEKYEEMISFTEQLLRDQDYKELIVFSTEIVNLSLSGLRYYHDYYQKPLLILVTLSFLGWAACLLKVLLEQKFSTQADAVTVKMVTSHQSRFLKLSSNAVCFMLFFMGTYLVYVQSLPVQYYLYIQMPLFLWFRALFPFDVWMYTLKQLKSSGRLYATCVQVIFYTFGCLALGMSFIQREILSIPLLGMAFWPFLSSKTTHLSHIIKYPWAFGTFLLCGFCFMPVVGKVVFIELVLFAGILWEVYLILHITMSLIPSTPKGATRREIKLTVLQMIILLIALQNIYVQSKRFERGTPVSHVDQAIAWIIAVTSLILPVLYSKNIMNRLVAISTSLFTFYLMMSVNHEGLFIISLTSHAIIWMVIEYSIVYGNEAPTAYLTIFCGFKKAYDDGENREIVDFTFGAEKKKHVSEIHIERCINDQDFRRAFFFMVYIVVAFFGTGNIASLNSFEVRWVTCFVTSFQPFLITTLILLKTFAPFLAVGCCFVAVQTLTEAPIGCLHVMVLIFTNLMGIQLLYNVRNTGSWLEIGTSISQFVIVQLITVFIVIINKIAKFYTVASIAGNVYKSGKKYV